jgi:phytoene synthase
LADLRDTLSPPARLALAYAPRKAKPVWLALLALDARLAATVAAGFEPIAAQLRLAWWRDILSAPSAAWPKGEPLLEALREWREPGCLAGLADGWELLLADHLTDQDIDDLTAARATGFVCVARELGRPEAAVAADACARWWILADLVTHVSDGDERQRLLERARWLSAPPRLPAELRPLAVLARLAATSLARGGIPLLAGPRSLFLALRTGLTGR